MRAHEPPVLVVEDDPFLRLVQVLLDPAAPAERSAAFGDFFAHDLPDFAGWRSRLHGQIGALRPAVVKLVATQEAFTAALPGASAAIVESLAVGERELAHADRLRAVQKYGTIVSGIDAAACRARGVSVLTLRRRANIACAEHAFGMMLALARKLVAINGLISVEQLQAAGYAPRMFDRRHTANSNWGRIPHIRTLHGKQLGIVGMGEIGRELALRAAAFGMNIVYTQRHCLPAEEESRYAARYCPLDALLAQSDFVSLHLPGTPATRGLIGARELAMLKRDAILVNISRPAIIDRDALLDALASGRLGGFGLDTPYEEPGRADDPLLAQCNVIVTPHIAAQPRFNVIDDFEEMLAGLSRALNLL